MLTLACALVLAAPAPGATLTKRNSISAEFLVATSFELNGVGCGSTATNSVTVAKARKGVSKAFGFRVRKPKVGDTDGYVRVTAVQVSDQTTTVTAVADAAQCTAQASGPPAQEAWSATFAPDISFFRRIQVRLRPDADRKAAKLRPRSMRIFDMDTLRRIRWKSFGGKIGRGTAKYRSGVRGVLIPQGMPRSQQASKAQGPPGPALPGLRAFRIHAAGHHLSRQGDSRGANPLLTARR